MKDPKECAVAADRRAAGIGPIMGGLREVVRALKKSRRDKAGMFCLSFDASVCANMPSDELTRRRELEPACKPPTSSGRFLAKEISALPDYLQPMRYARQIQTHCAANDLWVRP